MSAQKIAVYQERSASRYKNAKLIITEDASWAWTHLLDVVERNKKRTGEFEQKIIFVAYVALEDIPGSRAEVVGRRGIQVSIPRNTCFEPLDLSPGSKGQLLLLEEQLSEA